jgi:hypothetical protein
LVIREREILRVAATLGGIDRERGAEIARQEILKWAQKRAGSPLPPSAWHGDEFEHFAAGRNCSAVRIKDDTKDVWALRADDPDKTVAQRGWTVEAVVGRKPDQMARFSLRLLVSSPERDLRIEPSAPGLLQQVASECGLYRGSERLEAEPWLVESVAEAERLIDMLIDPARQIPIFVLTVPEHAADPQLPLIDAHGFSRATLGMAQTVILPARFTWALTERFGKRLSVYGGAARVYLPGFTEDANPYDSGHQLFLLDHQSTTEKAGRITGWLRRIAADESLRRLRLGHDVLSFSAVREQSLDVKRAQLEQRGASDIEQLTAAQAQVSSLKEDLQKSQEENAWLIEAHDAVEDRAKNAEAQLRAAGFRIQQLVEQLKTRGDTPDSNIPLPGSWAEFADWVDQNLIGRVLLTPRARREVKDALFQDVAVAARALLWLANNYRQLRISGGDGRRPIDSGIHNDRCGADTFQIQWQGRPVDVEWHIKNGGNTRDPGRCLRIYYFWDEASQQVVIASMPAHIRTGAT